MLPEQLPGAAGQVGGEVGAAQVHGDTVREQHRGRGQPGRYPAGQGRAGEPQLRLGLGVAVQVGECRRAQRRPQRAEHGVGRVGGCGGEQVQAALGVQVEQRPVGAQQAARAPRPRSPASPRA